MESTLFGDLFSRQYGHGPIYIYIYIYIYIKFVARSRGRPEGSLFNNYYTEV